MPGQGSGGNVLEALASICIPGLGQLLQDRLLMAILHFVLAAVVWIILLWSVLNAAKFSPRNT